jgi:hypothetical protein
MNACFTETMASFGYADKPAEKHLADLLWEKTLFRLKKQAEKYEL